MQALMLYKLILLGDEGGSMVDYSYYAVTGHFLQKLAISLC